MKNEKKEEENIKKGKRTTKKIKGGKHLLFFPPFFRLKFDLFKTRTSAHH